MRLAIAVIGIALLIAACDSAPASSANHTSTSSPTTSAGALLVFTTWVPDSKVAGGVEPGYRPAFSGLTGHDVQMAAPVLDASGTVWLLNVTFTPAGSRLFAKLTLDNVNACPGDPATNANANCAQRHLSSWLGLTQQDIDSWEN